MSRHQVDTSFPGRRLKGLMGFPATYSVVGVRADGAHVEIASGVSREVAESALKTLPTGRYWREFQMRWNGNWPPRPAAPGMSRSPWLPGLRPGAEKSGAR